VGVGTEQLEENLKNLFPDARVQRMDLDTTRAKYSYQQIITDFENQQIDILVGTQMVSKGLDFDHVGLVGIVQADQLWSTPSFRANERAFQLIQQVSGRAGRKHGEGQVYIQTYKPDHWVLEYAKEHNLKKFYHHELQNRKEFEYPPYKRLIQITLKHKQVQKVENASYFLAGQLRKNMPQSVLGPTVPGISRIKNQYLRDILVKSLPTAKVLNRTKMLIRQAVEKLEAQKDLKSVQVHMDVDP
jgi:primosomal protein N' (replication factor Y)